MTAHVPRAEGSAYIDLTYSKSVSPHSPLVCVRADRRAMRAGDVTEDGVIDARDLQAVIDHLGERSREYHA